MIVITGASGGIGSYLIERLAGDHPILALYHTRRPEKSLPNVEYHAVDVADAKSVDDFATAVAPKLSKVVLLNLAGVSLDGMGHSMKEDTWQQVIGTNLSGTFHMSRALLKPMRAEGWGRIINVSSIVGQVGVPGTSAYSASKSGIFGLTRTLAAENATKGITVNALALGYFAMGMIATIKPEIQAQIKAKIPMKRFGEPAEVELAVRFLIDCAYMTGSVLNVNGGLF